MKYEMQITAYNPHYDKEKQLFYRFKISERLNGRTRVYIFKKQKRWFLHATRHIHSYPVEISESIPQMIELKFEKDNHRADYWSKMMEGYENLGNAYNKLSAFLRHDKPQGESVQGCDATDLPSE